MIRIRFHGRGGHGTKTASRIVGTAAFLQGYQAQDSPVYGAERRGAAVVAFTRLGSDPILERGIIEQPDLIILADETLLASPDAHVLAHQEFASAMFINTSNVAALVQQYGIVARVVTYDLTTLTMETLGTASALSAGLAAAAARMTGMITQDELGKAVREELAQRHLAEDLIEKNVTVANKVFTSLERVAFRPLGRKIGIAMAELAYQGPRYSTPSVLHAGNAELRNTGGWRVERPVIDTSVCTRCGLCFVRCPDGAIALDADGFPVIDYDHCKGCMICQQVCPLHAIALEKETRAW